MMIPRFCFWNLMQLYFLMNSSFWVIAHRLMCWFESIVFADWLFQSGRKVSLIIYNSFCFLLLFSQLVRLPCLRWFVVSNFAQCYVSHCWLQRFVFKHDDSTVLLLTFDAIVLPDEYKVFFSSLMVFWVGSDSLGSLTDASNVVQFSVGRYWLQLFSFSLHDASTVLLLTYDAIVLPDD